MNGNAARRTGHRSEPTSSARSSVEDGPAVATREPPLELGAEWMWSTFPDRAEAGRRLGARLAGYRTERPLILGLARGGLPVAAEVARALGAPVDVLVVRKLGVPWHAELGVGALAEGGVSVIDDAEAAALGIDRASIDRAIEVQSAELEGRVRRYRGGRPAPSLDGRTVIVVDDGIATGGTMRAAIEAVERRKARRVVVAVPVAPPAKVAELRPLVDDLVVLRAEEPFLAVAQFYEEFPQVSDEEVATILAERIAPDQLPSAVERSCDIDLGPVVLRGDLVIPEAPRGVVLFAHGSGSSRLSSRNRSVARTLNEARFATLLFDLLTSAEEEDRSNVFDVELLAGRLVRATAWVRGHPALPALPTGYFGASTGAAAALLAAADLGSEIGAVVSRGGRPDLVLDRLSQVVAPTLLIVGGDDHQLIALNRGAAGLLRCVHELEIVPGATHLFEEPGALERVGSLASTWFARHLGPA
jgi:predicted phosphoribosyltransferase